MATLTYKGSYINKNSYNQGDVVVYPVNTPWVAWANVKPGVRPGVNPLEWGNVPKGTGDSILFNGITLSVDDWLDNLATSTTILNPSACIEVPKPVDYNILARLQALEAINKFPPVEPDYNNRVQIPLSNPSTIVGTSKYVSFNHYSPPKDGYISVYFLVNHPSAGVDNVVEVWLHEGTITSFAPHSDELVAYANEITRNLNLNAILVRTPVLKDKAYTIIPTASNFNTATFSQLDCYFFPQKLRS